MRLFSTSATVTYAGSESGEKATGPTELRRLFSDLLGRAVAYSFEFRDITFSEQNELVWMLADGDGTQPVMMVRRRRSGTGSLGFSQMKRSGSRGHLSPRLPDQMKMRSGAG